MLGCFLICCGAAAALQNGGFENVAADGMPGWQVQAQQASVQADRIRGKWYHFVCDVKPGRFDRIHLHLSFQPAGIGSVWWDNFRSGSLRIRNPDFEEITPSPLSRSGSFPNLGVLRHDSGSPGPTTHSRSSQPSSASFMVMV